MTVRFQTSWRDTQRSGAGKWERPNWRMQWASTSGTTWPKHQEVGDSLIRNRTKGTERSSALFSKQAGCGEVAERSRLPQSNSAFDWNHSRYEKSRHENGSTHQSQCHTARLRLAIRSNERLTPVPALTFSRRGHTGYNHTASMDQWGWRPWASAFFIMVASHITPDHCTETPVFRCILSP